MMGKRFARAIIFLLAYLPLLGIPFFNKIEPRILGIPFLWLYCMLWSIFVFALLILSYIVDRR